jgi:hypothetical protein
MARSKDNDTVRESADPGKNTAWGGHVTQHIYDMTPPPGKSQQGRTLFKSRREFEQIWKQYLYYADGVNLSGNQAQEVVDCTKLHVGLLEARSCTAVDAQGRCTQYTLYVARSFFFGFLLVGKKWILNTCFPQPMA